MNTLKPINSALVISMCLDFPGSLRTKGYFKTLPKCLCKCPQASTLTGPSVK